MLIVSKDSHPDRGVGKISAKHKLLNLTHACKIRTARGNLSLPDHASLPHISQTNHYVPATLTSRTRSS